MKVLVSLEMDGIRSVLNLLGFPFTITQEPLEVDITDAQARALTAHGVLVVTPTDAEPAAMARKGRK